MRFRIPSTISFEILQRRSLSIVFFILILLAFSLLAEQGVLYYLDTNWGRHITSYTAQQLQEVNTAFNGVQRRVRQIATEVARHPSVTSYLLNSSNDAADVFAHVARIARNQDVSAEVYDDSGDLIAWYGRSGPADPHEIQLALKGILTSYVTHGPIYSQLFVISPIRAEGKIRGAVIVREAVEVNYPISNRFIKPAGLAEQLSAQLGVMVEIAYGEAATPRADGRYGSIELRGIDGRKLGVASILRYSKSAYMDDVRSLFGRIHSAIMVLLFGMVLVALSRHFKVVPGVMLRALILTAVIWLTRYMLLWLGIPEIWISTGIFDPKYFASKFWGGIAKSIGEMSITAIALFVNVALVLRLVAAGERTERLHTLPRALRIALAVGSTTLIYLLLRGYAAVLRSAVFDSSLRFNDTTVTLPSLELALMVVNLFLISFSFIVVAVWLSLIMIKLFRREAEGWGGNRFYAMVIGVLFLAASVLFGVLQETPLMSTGFRLLFGALLLIFTLRIFTQLRRKRPVVTFTNALYILAFSSFIFYWLMDNSIHDQDKSRIETLAREVMRPVDNWLRFVVDESLAGFAKDESFDVLLHGDSSELERLAFTVWATSPAARQGSTCLFAVFDPDSNEISRFAIGESNPAMYDAAQQALRTDSQHVVVREVGRGLGGGRIYSGAIPIVAADRLLGYGVVVIAAAQHSLFRGETPGVFKSVSQDNLEAFYRQTTLNEYRNGVLVSSSNPRWPVQRRLPDNIANMFADSTRMSAWGIESAGGKTYEMLFVRRAHNSEEIIGLGLEQPSFFWHLLGVVRTLVFFTLVLALSIVSIYIYRRLRGMPYVPSFRDRLLAAMLLTATLPVVIIAVYARVFATERVSTTLSNQLNRETAIIEEELASRFVSDSFATGAPPLIVVEDIAARLKADFGYYSGNMLLVTSRPELYDTGILDRRMSGTAFSELFINGQRFHMEMENIGSYRYAVGYRPVIGPGGEVEAVLSVPTLYRQEQIDEEVAQINAVLFGVSAVIFFVMAFVATTFANRIAAPILRLTEATKRVALGDLDVEVKVPADGEIGQLVRSFVSMTRELKRSRENLVQYEREMAWKEMAKQVAHEIKNPLTPMKLALQHLRQTYKDKVENFDEIFEEVSQMVIRQVDALSRIASEFSSFARMPKARLERLSVNDVLREAVYLFEQDVRVHVEARYETHLPPIMADREELRRAFINIIRNGIQAMDNEGKIEVTTERQDANIVIRIRDYGCGIPDQILDKLFQPNFSTKTDGMGLGLAIVKKTVDDLNGLVVVESKVNEGTTFIITIPIQDHEHADSHSHN